MHKFTFDLDLSHPSESFKRFVGYIHAESFNEAAGILIDYITNQKWLQDSVIVEAHDDIFNATCVGFNVTQSEELKSIDIIREAV